VNENMWKFVLIFGFFLTHVSAQEKMPITNHASDEDTVRVQNSLPAQNEKIFIEKIEVEGKLEKPQAVFILPGQTPAIDDIQIERSFLTELFRPVEAKTTFETVHNPTVYRLRKDVLDW